MSINKVLLVGNLGKDPDLRYTPSGAAVCTFSLATSDKFKNKAGETQENTEWHNIIAWQRLAEICGEYLHKGKQVYVEGKLQTRSYEDRNGNKRNVTEIVISQMQMLGSKPARRSPVTDNDDWGTDASESPDMGNAMNDEIPYDDIPF